MADDKRREPRVPAGLNVKLAYGSVDEFIERHAVNISRGGIFVRTVDPQPPGTPVLLSIALESGEHVIRGKGVVRWTAPPSAPGEPERLPGMGVKFTELDAESRALVDLVVATRGPDGASAEPPVPESELDGAAPAPDAARPPAPQLRPVSEPAHAPRASPAAVPARAPPGPVAGPTQAVISPRPAAVPPPVAAPAVADEDFGDIDLELDLAGGPARGDAPKKAAARAARVPEPPARAPVQYAKKSKKVVGIDLGTTNSCVAVAEDGKARIIASREGHRTTPSVVAFDTQARLLVGHAAKAQMVINPKNTVYGSKRLVGRAFASPTVQACRDRFHYEIVEGANGAASVRFAGRDFSLQQVAAFILAELKEVASQALGEEVTRAVVTVPAYYNDAQRQAVRDAGVLAGLKVERIVNEPTAAALAFGYGKGLDKRILVYDLGGGTFDASVLEIQGDVYEVISTGGDTFLGGVDFDNQVLDHLIYRFIEKHGHAPPEDRVVYQRMRDAAEDVKVALSSREVAVAHVQYLTRDAAGNDVDLQVDLSRAELEGITEQLVQRTIEVCREVLAAKGLTKNDIHEVLLVGGQSRMPLVWRKIREEFGREPNKGVHPDEAVAVGAALLADSETRIDSVVLIDVLAMGIGVGLPGGRMAPVLPRNTKLPAKKAYELGTTRDGQTELELAVFQGDSPKVSECEYLGTVRVTSLPPKPRGQVKVAVEFSLGGEGILNVTARNLATSAVTHLQFATLDTPASLREKLQIPEVATAPKGSRPLDAPARAAPHAHPPSAPPVAAAAGEKKGLFGRFFGKK